MLRRPVANVQIRRIWTFGFAIDGSGKKSFGVRGKPVLFLSEKGPSSAVENRLRFSTADGEKKNLGFVLLPFGQLDKSVIAQKIACDFLSDLRFFFSRKRKKFAFFLSEKRTFACRRKSQAIFDGRRRKEKSKIFLFQKSEETTVPSRGKQDLRSCFPLFPPISERSSIFLFQKSEENPFFSHVFFTRKARSSILLSVVSSDFFEIGGKPVFFTEPYMLLSPPKIACDFRGGPARQKNRGSPQLVEETRRERPNSKNLDVRLRHICSCPPRKSHAIFGGDRLAKKILAIYALVPPENRMRFSGGTGSPKKS